jgi:hypothetical protein
VPQAIEEKAAKRPIHLRFKLCFHNIALRFFLGPPRPALGPSIVGAYPAAKLTNRIPRLMQTPSWSAFPTSRDGDAAECCGSGDLFGVSSQTNYLAPVVNFQSKFSDVVPCVAAICT